MSIRPIVKVPNEILLTKCEPIKEFGDITDTLIQDLIDTLEHAKNPEGAGLASPQIGILKRIIVARNFYKDPRRPSESTFENIVLINPKIISKSTETDIDWEACLSIPDTYGKVQRYSTIKVKSHDNKGGEFVIKAQGLFARIIQHEMDHLDGILFTDRLIGKTISEKELDKLLGI